MKNKITLLITFLSATAFAVPTFTIPGDKETVFSSPAVGQTTLNRHFRLLSWNILKGDRMNDWVSDFRSLSPQYDLLALQEATSESIVMNEMNRLKNSYHYDFVVSWIKDKTQVKSGVLTLSKAQPVSLKWMRTDDLEPIVKTPKVTAASFFDVGGGVKIALLNIHAINAVNTDKFEKHLRQSLELIKNHKGPVIFIGDFNTRNKARIAKARSIVAEFGMKEYDFKRIKVADMLSHLDRVYARGIIVHKVEMLENIRSSDHFPISMDISIP